MSKISLFLYSVNLELERIDARAQAYFFVLITELLLVGSFSCNSYNVWHMLKPPQSFHPH